MMKRAMRSAAAVCLGLCVVGLFASAARAAEEMIDNPSYVSWAKQKPGTAVTLESNSAVAGQQIKTEVVSKLVKLEKENAVVEVATKINLPGVPAPMPQTVNIPAKVTKDQG